MTGATDDPHVALVDEAATGEAIAERSRRRVLADVDAQEATFRSTLWTAAARGGTVVVDTSVGVSIRGRIRAVGPTHLVVEDVSSTSHVRIDHVTAVRAGAASPPLCATGGEFPSGGRRDGTHDELAELAREHAEVDVHLAGGAVARGALRRVGADVLTLRGSRADVLVNRALAAVVTVRRGAT